MRQESKSKIHAGHIECAVAVLIDYRAHTIVPNVSHGLYLNHECDMLVLDKNNRFTEVEIKISISDLKADFKKSHGHKSKYISRLVYAVPHDLLDKSMKIIPDEFGVISVRWVDWGTIYNGHSGYWKAEWVRTVRHSKNAEKPPQSIINKFYQLGCMRIWSLKNHNNRWKKK
jgi:hypothetical protein